MTLFDTGAFDLDAYLARIGYVEPRDASLDTLRQIVLAHACAIPFENLNPLLKRPVRLDITSIQDKLVRGGRGGWCFEHNLLLGRALTALGYDVSGLAARVRWGVAPGVVRSRSHMVLLLTIAAERLLVDVGFGGPTPTAPLRLDAGVEQLTPHGPYRVTAADEGFLLEARVEGTWRSLYSFDLQTQELADYEMANWYLCNHSDSHFLSTLVAARAARDRRHALRNNELAVHFPDGRTERQTLASAADVRHAFQQVFCVNVPDWPELDAALERVIPAPTAHGTVD